MEPTPKARAQAVIDALGPDELARAASYTMGNHALLLLGTLVAIVAAWIILRSGLLDRLAARIERRGRRPNRVAFLVGGAFLLLVALLTFPLEAYAGWWRERAFGRTDQPFTDWLAQGLLALTLSTVLGALFLTGLYALIRRAGRRWWLWAGGLVTAVLVVLLLVAPVAIAPLFNEYRPLPEGPVRDALVAQAAEAGIPADRIFVYDGSRQSNNFTANVTGVFGSARIAISDVAFEGATLEEVQAVTGHEIGHYVLGHVWRMVAVTTLLALVLLFLIHRSYPWFARRLGTRARLADPRGLPVLYVIATLAGLLAQPLVNAVIRQGEWEADRYSLETVNLPEGLVTALVQTAEYRDPRPARWQELLFYTHPSIERRVIHAYEWAAANPPGPPAVDIAP